MDKKSKALLAIVVFSVFLSIGVTFYKSIILRDFSVVNTTKEE
ncbi:MAG: hypothetical protein NTW98_03320 [Candidatus Nomurabacteria bacterium]|nr:hypothetical protein [Candidatus Nomurabacteria bacterium]